VVSPLLPRAFAVPAAYGDLIAGLLAIAATLTLWKRSPGATALVWVFNVWGAADLLFAGFQGRTLGIDPGAFGAAFFLPTTVVPFLLVTHALTFRVLVFARRVPLDDRSMPAGPTPERGGGTSPGSPGACSARATP
jgi:hypothetical protein